MRLIIIGVAILLNASLFAQSKKDLQTEITALKAQIEQLKKPAEIDLNNVHGKASYAFGLLIGSNVRKQGGDSLVIDIVNAAIKDAYLNKAAKMTEQECIMVVQPYIQKVVERKSTKAKEESRVFLEANKSKEGVMTTASGLQYKVLVAGKGKSPGPQDNVTVHYTGKLIDGTVFDSSVKNGQPATFRITEVIPGWTEALQLMHEGDKWMLYIPYQLAYGERGAGADIPPFAALTFELELIKVN